MTEDEAKAILTLGYTWLIDKESDGTYFGRVREFPGCFATGDTFVETGDRLYAVAISWLMANEVVGFPVPEPTRKRASRAKKQKRLGVPLDEIAQIEREGDHE